MAGSLILNQFYEQMHSMYPQKGISFLVGEHRGTGIITPFVHDTTDGVCGNAFEIFEDSVVDIDAWINCAIDMGYEEIWLQGHSLGPSKMAYYASRDAVNLKVKGLIFISPSDMAGLVRTPDAIGLHQSMLSEAEALVLEGGSKSILSISMFDGEMLSAQTYINFFSDNSACAIFNFGQPQFGWEIVNKIKLPTLAITGTKDDGIVPVCDPHKAMKTLEMELKNSKEVKTLVYEGAEHSFDGFGQKIVEDVSFFVGLT